MIDKLPGLTNTKVRVVLLVVSALFMLGLWFVAVSVINARLAGGIGLTIALVAGSLLPLGVLLVYHNVVDWLNLRLMRRSIESSQYELPDGEPVAFSGVVRTDDPAMCSPVTNIACAAFTYRYSASRPRKRNGSRSRTILAQGFHMIRTRIEGSARTVTLGSLPGFESDMVEANLGSKWAKQIREHIL